MIFQLLPKLLSQDGEREAWVAQGPDNRLQCAQVHWKSVYLLLNLNYIKSFREDKVKSGTDRKNMKKLTV